MDADVKTSASGGGRRPYRSQVRQEGARRTRAAVVAAATELFVERGYEQTSLADVAVRAGVARPTVTTAFRTKAALLAEVLDQALAGDDEPVPVRDRAWFRPVWEATTGAAVLQAYARVCTLIGRRAGHVVEVLHRASDSSPDVAEVWERWLRGRRIGAGMVVERDVVVAVLRPGLTPELAGDIVWRLNDPELYVSLVEDRGWGEERYEAWLADAMVRLFLDEAQENRAL